VQQLQPFRGQLRSDEADAGGVPARVCQTRDEASFDRIIACREHDGNGRGRCLGFPYPTPGRDEDRNVAANQIRRQSRQSIVSALGPPKFDRDILAFDESGLAEAVAKGGNVGVPRSRPLTG